MNFSKIFLVSGFSLKLSTVSTFFPSSWTANLRHDLAVKPSIFIVQEPHIPCSHPTWVPVKLRLSLKKSDAKSLAGTVKSYSIPFIVVLTNPTTGGVTASWATLGDILIAEPKATIGFAGKRVIQDTVRETLPEEFQTAEYVKDHGGLDLVIERKYLNTTIGTLLNVLLKKQETQVKNDSSDVVTISKTLQTAS